MVASTSTSKVAYNTSSGGPGAQWFTGTGAPAGGLGSTGDMYLNLAVGAGNGDVYQKIAGVWTLVGNIKGPTGASGVTMLEWCVLADGANLTLTSQPAAEDYLDLSARPTGKLDLGGGFVDCRLVVRKIATAGFAGAHLDLKYSTTNPASAFSAGAWNASGAAVVIDVQNVTLDSGWIAMPAGMKAANLFVAITEAGGNGVLSPVIGSVRAYFR